MRGAYRQWTFKMEDCLKTERLEALYKRMVHLLALGLHLLTFGIKSHSRGSGVMRTPLISPQFISELGNPESGDRSCDEPTARGISSQLRPSGSWLNLTRILTLQMLATGI